MQKFIYVDKSILTPKDYFKTLEEGARLNSVRGIVKVSDSKGNVIGENLVVLSGREFLAEKFADVNGGASGDYSNYKIRYFGIGSGGAEEDPNTGDPTVKKGPYANDTGLYNPIKFSNGNSADGTTYIDTGFLKNIEADSANGSGIAIESETHEIATETGAINVSAYTVIHYTMFVNPDEVDNRPFEFNECALFAVEYDSSGQPVLNGNGTTNKSLIAHFTTSSKFIEVNESLRIDWYILV